MKIHAIQTGTVQVRERQRSGVGQGLGRFANTLMDRTWTEPLPILAWAIEHAEGVIVVDTGETALAARPGYFPRWHPYFRVGLREQVRPDQELGPALRRLGIGPTDVRWTVMTHLHTDHAGGLHHVGSSEVLVSAQELSDATGLPGRLRGYLPHRWPRDLEPSRVGFTGDPWGPFPASVPVTRAGDVRLVPTPGHTRGHLSVVVDRGDHLVFLAGDTSYTETHLREGTVDGVSSLGGGAGAAALTLARIRRLGRTRPMVYLPSHDPGSATRLQRRITFVEARTSEDSEASPAPPRTWGGAGAASRLRVSLR